MITVPDDDAFFLDSVSYMNVDDVARVRDALAYARRMHEGMVRGTGEPFVTHPMTVAYYLAQYQLDAPAIIAALLHDVAEDTKASVAEIGEAYGADVAQIVDGLTKVEETEDSAKRKDPLFNKDSATHNKLFRMMIADERIALIKIADRLHNTRTMAGLPPYKQEKKARETMHVYAPLAYRLGMWKTHTELTECAIEILYPAIYAQIKQKLIERSATHMGVMRQIKRAMSHQKQYGIEPVDVYLSPRSVWSIFNKCDKRDLAHMQVRVDDIPRIVIVVPTRLDCYKALGVAHKIWSPQSTNFTDSIGGHSDNLYRALHTTVMTNKRLVKLRFRTPAMRLMSEVGILSMWSHQAKAWPPLVQFDVQMQVQGLMKRFRESIDAGGTIDGGIDDVLARQISVFTPSGEEKELPHNATPIDFAYAIHSDVGDACHQAYINGELQPLNTRLQEGDIVRIKCRPNRPRPQRIWLVDELGYLTTSRAKKRARGWFRKLPSNIAMEQGKQLLADELHLIGLPKLSHEKIARLEGNLGELDLYHALGRAEKRITDISTRVLVRYWDEGKLRQRGNRVVSAQGENFVIYGAGKFSKLMMCRNCHPRPGDKIMGFIRQNGEKVTVHQESCHQLPTTNESARLLQLRWGEESTGLVRLVTVYVAVHDRHGILHEISHLLNVETVNIASVEFPYQNKPLFKIEIEVQTPRQLVTLLHQIRAMVNITDVWIGHENNAVNVNK